MAGAYLQAPPGWQPWNVASAWQVDSWDEETTYDSTLTNPPPAGTAVLVANITMTATIPLAPTAVLRPAGLGGMAVGQLPYGSQVTQVAPTPPPPLSAYTLKVWMPLANVLPLG